MSALCRIFFFIFLIIYALDIHGATYYFSSVSGNDNRSFQEAQNQNTPWKTLAKFNAIFPQLQAGDRVYFKRGEKFQGTLIISKSGTAALPIVIGAYGSGVNPIITGFVTVSQWTNLGNGIYQSGTLNTGSEVNILVIDGINYARGRYPNSSSTNGGYLDISSVGTNSVTSQQLSANPDWDGAEMVLRARHWSLEKTRITNHSGNTINYTGQISYGPLLGYGFFIQDHINTLDQLGEWFYDKNTKKISIYFGNQNPTGKTIKVAALSQLVTITSDYIHFENLHLEGSNDFTITNNYQNITGLSFNNCTINFSGGDAIFLHSAFNFTLENCTITNSNNVGINLHYCPNATVRSNIIENTGIQAGMGKGGDGNYTAIHSEASGFIAEYNHILNSGYIALRFGVGDNLIKNNFINTFCTVLDDGAGIYTYDSDGAPATRKVEGNIVINGMGASPGTLATTVAAADGIYMDDNTQNISIINNTVSNCVSSGLFLHNTQNLKVQGNTLYNNSTQSVFKSDQFGNALTGLDVDNNIFFSKSTGQSVFEVISDANNIGNIGAIDHNYYVRPFYDLLPIAAEYPNAEGTVLRTLLEIPEWQVSFGHGQGSQKSPVQLKYYKITEITTNNKLPNEGFDNDIVGTWCYSPYSDCQTSWETNNQLAGGSLKVSGPSPSRIGMYCGNVLNSKHYVIRFSAIASKNSSLEIFLMQDKSPWEIISASLSVQLSTQAQDYEILISNPVNESQSTIQFQFGNSNTTYWIDDIQMYEASVSLTSPDEYIRFEYNNSLMSKNINLSDDYVDAKGNPYSGMITLEPYQSTVLIKNSCIGSTAQICETGTCSINGNPITPNIYYASNSISSNGRISNGATVEFTTGAKIELNPGFQVDLGGNFEARIVDCSVINQ